MDGRCSAGGGAVRKEAEEVFIQQHSDSAEFLCLEEPRRAPVKPGVLPRMCCVPSEEGGAGKGHAHPHRKFILSFQCTEGSGSPEEECIMAKARAKCREFWDNVDNDEKLAVLIRRGVPVPEKSEQRQGRSTPSTPAHRTDSEKIREGQKQPIELKSRYAKERARMEAQKKATMLLEDRSGQRRYKARPKKDYTIKDVFADAIPETWESAARSMMEYDNAKKIDN